MRAAALLLIAQACFGTCAVSWSNGFTKCVEITLDHTKIPNTNQTDFPNMICFNGAGGTNCDASLGTLTLANLKVTGSGGVVTSSTCLDCIWTSDNAGTTLLDWETDSYTGASGFAIFWVKKTRSHTVDDKVYLFIGKSGASDQSNPTGVWPLATWQNVHHFGTPSSLTGTNSTGRLSSGSSTALTAHGATAGTGIINGGPATNTGAYMSADTDASLIINNNGPGAFSISCWGKTAIAADRGYCMTMGANTNTNGLRLGVASNCGTPYAAEFSYGNVGTATGASPGLCGAAALNDNAWHYFVGTVAANGDDMTLYVDGVSVNTTNSTNHAINANSNPLHIGRAVDLAHLEDFWPGVIDEVHITAAVQLSADWITAEYNNQSSPSTFYSAAAPVVSATYVRHRVVM